MIVTSIDESDFQFLHRIPRCLGRRGEQSERQSSLSIPSQDSTPVVYVADPARRTFNSFTGFHIDHQDCACSEVGLSIPSPDSTSEHMGSRSPDRTHTFQFLHRIPLAAFQGMIYALAAGLFQFLHRIPQLSGKEQRRYDQMPFQFLHRIPRTLRVEVKPSSDRSVAFNSFTGFHMSTRTYQLVEEKYLAFQFLHRIPRELLHHRPRRAALRFQFLHRIPPEVRLL